MAQTTENQKMKGKNHNTIFTLLRISVHTNYSRCPPKFGTLCDLVVQEIITNQNHVWITN